MNMANLSLDQAECSGESPAGAADFHFEGRKRQKAKTASLLGDVLADAATDLIFDGLHEVGVTNCLQAKGWLIADGKPQAPYPPPSFAGYYPDASGGYPAQSVRYDYDPANFAREQAAFEAKRAAEAWLQAERVLNDGDPASRKELYLVLCGAGDGSACEMAAVLKHSVYR